MPCMPRSLASLLDPRPTAGPASQLQPLPDTFETAEEWAGLLQPFLLLEMQAGLRQALEQLGSAKWLPLDGVPELRRDNDQRGGGGGLIGGEEDGLGGFAPPTLCKATVNFTVRGQDRSGAGAGDWRAARAATAAAAASQAGGGGWVHKKPPPLKPTDIVLLVNARVSDEFIGRR